MAQKAIEIIEGLTRDVEVGQIYTGRITRLMSFEVSRARCYYNAARPLVQMVHDSGRPGLRAMIEIYSSLLDKIERSGYDVFTNRISLPAAKKLSIAARAMLASRLSGGKSYPERSR